MDVKMFVNDWKAEGIGIGMAHPVEKKVGLYSGRQNTNRL